MENFPLQNETYKIIGLCMDVQKTLGFGFSEVVYKDAMEMDFIESYLPYVREAQLEIDYKGKKLRHKFVADFMCFDKIIIEVKSCDKGITGDHIAQTLNYIHVSGSTLGMIINFAKKKLEYKRLISSYPVGKR